MPLDGHGVHLSNEIYTRISFVREILQDKFEPEIKQESDEMKEVKFKKKGKKNKE